MKKLLSDTNRLTWVISAVWAVFMLAMLFLPGRMIPLHMVNNEDKLFHFGGFTVFSGLAVLSVRNFPRIFYLTHSSFVMAIGSGCGIVTEMMQQGIVGRSTSSEDGLANIAGVLFGIIVTNIIIFCSKKSRIAFKRSAAVKDASHKKEPVQFTELRPRFFCNPDPTP